MTAPAPAVSDMVRRLSVTLDRNHRRAGPQVAIAGALASIEAATAYLVQHHGARPAFDVLTAYADSVLDGAQGWAR